MNPTPIRMTTVDISKAAKNAGSSDELEMKYMEFETLQVEAVTAQRVASASATEAIISQQRAVQSFIKFLSFAGEVADVVKREANWMLPYRNREGSIFLQSPMTRKDQRLAANLMHNQMAKQADEEHLGDMFGHEGDGENE